MLILLMFCLYTIVLTGTLGLMIIVNRGVVEWK